MAESKFVNTKNARAGHQYERVIKEIAERKVCPFCPEHIEKYHKNPILRQGPFWLVSDNMYPYQPTKNHLILIHKNHIERIGEISSAGWQELHEHIKEVTRERNLSGGSFLLRFGDTNYTGASVTHLHAHLIQSDPGNESYDHSGGLFARIG